ncbi:MAG: hypothetical protein GTN62_07445 [Gemmatimonadales bacterium]|nr:hypothetical protein [Gemmatimonadales bacterium]NIP07398.1 hypothetical protein [Gemmatimonadales bacterium]NIS63888.1 hypothetical protein [Gemmatimonadales bacterium]
MLGGALVSAVALVTVYAVVPYAQRWMDREAEIAAKAEQRARLETLIERQEAMRETVAGLRRERGQTSGLLLAGNTPAVAASDLQLLIKRYADESRVLLERVDVAGEVDVSGDSLVPIPARLTARGDIFGLVDLLFYLQNGEKLLVIDDFRISAGRFRRATDQLVTWTVTLHGYYAPGETVS